jgi:phosphonate transport system substrate-binding protein
MSTRFLKLCKSVGRFVVLALLAVQAGGAKGVVYAEDKTLTLAVVPQSSQVVLMENWQPFIDYIQRKTGITLNQKFYTSIPEFEAGILNGEADLIFCNPLHMAQVHSSPGYIPLVHDGSRQLSGILLVRHDSPFQDIQQLKGQKVSMPEGAFAAESYMKSNLAKEGVVVEPVSVKTHPDSYQNVIKGITAAGSGVQKTFKELPVEDQIQLRTIYTTPGVTPHPLAIHSRIPAEIQTLIQNTVLEMSQSESGKKILKTIQLTEPKISDYARDYQMLENLQLTNSSK